MDSAAALWVQICLQCLGVHFSVTLIPGPQNEDGDNLFDGPILVKGCAYSDCANFLKSLQPLTSIVVVRLDVADVSVSNLVSNLTTSDQSEFCASFSENFHWLFFLRTKVLYYNYNYQIFSYRENLLALSKGILAIMSKILFMTI